MVKFVIIDGHAILYRAYHALPPLTTSKGQLVNAVFGFTSMLLRVVKDLKPTHLAVVFDTPEPTFRNKLYKEYQSQRPKADDEFISQIDIVKKVIKSMNISIFEKAGFEADDVIGTLAYKASGRETKTKNQKPKTKNKNIKIDEVVIVTGDRDILQLVSETVKVYMPVRGLSKSKMWDRREVEKKFGITPKQIADYKALMGDTSDNYPGVSGIGPKTAKDLLGKYQTLDEIYKHRQEIGKKSIREKLEKGKEDAEVSKKLARIVTDVSLSFDLRKCKLEGFDKPEVHWILEDLEFKSLIPRLNTRSKKKEIRIKNHKKKKAESKQISMF